MNRFAIPVFLLLAGCLLLAEPAAAAGPLPIPVGRAFKIAGGGPPPIPPEWGGIWSVTDSLYTCQGVLIFAAPARLDTICTDGTYGDPEPVPECSEADCNGTATATTLDMTCTATCVFEPDCSTSSVSVFHSERTADAFFTVITVSTTNTGTGCTTPDGCLQINSHGTRVEPEPLVYCATPVEEMTWGRVKSRYH